MQIHLMDVNFWLFQEKHSAIPAVLQECCAHVQEGALLAEAKSPFGVRILRVDVDMEQQLLVCGDRTGNVLAFHFDPACLSYPGDLQLDLLFCD